MTRRTTAARCAGSLLLIVAADELRSTARAGRRRSSGERRQGSAELADVLRRVFQPSLQRPHPDHAGQRQEPRAEMDVSGRRRRRVADLAARRRRRDVSHAAAERRGRARRENRPCVLDLSPYAGPDADRLLRREQPRPRDSRRHAVHGHARRASGRDRCEDGPRHLEHEGGREQGRLLGDACAAGRERQSDRRRRRRRVRDSRLRRRLRRAKRQGSVALLHHSRAERAGRRFVEAVPAEDRRYVLRSRGVEARRRIGLGDGLLRSRAQSHVLGRRQRRPGLEQRAAARRQPVHRFGRRARRRHRPAEMALPVHAARSSTTTTRCRCRCSPTSRGGARRSRR